MIIKYNNHLVFIKTINISDKDYPVLFKIGDSIDILNANIFAKTLCLILFINKEEKIKIKIYINSTSANKPFLIFDFFKEHIYSNENIFPNNIKIFNEKFISLFNLFVFMEKPPC